MSVIVNHVGRRIAYIFLLLSYMFLAIASAEELQTKYLGGLSPEDAYTFMTTTEDLVIIDVREPKWIDETFEGSVNIPWVDMKTRVDEIPAHKNVILNCGAGIVAPKAYEIIKVCRNDLLSLAYIAGHPLFKEYNSWLKKQPKE